MKILIADDDAMTRIALRKNLGKWGYEVIEAKDGKTAWDIISGQSPPKLALLDWMMPEMEGVEICRQLDNNKDIPFIYTILLTIRNEKEDIAEGLDSGACDFLSKPVHTIELRSRIAVGVRLVEAENKISAQNKELTKSNTELSRINEELQLALEEIKTLKGILPICSNCKKIRLENSDPKNQNSWIILENYISRKTDAKFSHGLCPECMYELYPEFVSK